MKKRRLAILGSTAASARRRWRWPRWHPDRFEVAALTAYSSREKLFEQVRAFRPRLAGLVQPIPREEIPADLRFCEWVFGPEALTLAAQADADDVLVSVVGMVGLKSVLTALAGGKRVLLANKEALVAGGHLVMEAAGAWASMRFCPWTASTAPLSVPSGSGRESVFPHHPDLFRRSVPHLDWRRDSGSHKGTGAQASQLGHGTEDHH